MSKYTALYQLPLPPSPEEARKHNEARYWSNKPCTACNNLTPIRYVLGDDCFGCAQVAFKEGLFYALNDPTDVPEDIPTTPAEANDMGLDFYFTGDACKKANHAEKKSTISGKCMNCPTRSPRQQAIANGDRQYIPATPCKHCHTLAPRLVTTSGCTGCAAPPRKPGKPAHEPSAILMRDCKDIVIGRKEARAMGFNVYRTGQACNRGHNVFRYVSTGGCIECRGVSYE